MKFKQKGAFKIKGTLKKATKVLLIFSLVLLYSNVRPGAASAADDTVSNETHLTYHCTVTKPIPTEFDMPVTIKGTVPKSVTPGQEVTITNSQTVVTVPAETVGIMAILGDHVSGQTTKFEIKSENEDKTINVADQASLPIPETVVDPSKPLELTVPQPPISVTGFKAGSEGTLTLNAGEIDTKMDVHHGAGTTGTTVEASCVPTDKDTTIAAIPIEKAVDAAPVITLNGDNPMQLEVGDEYKEPGATATDDMDGDLTSKIKISGQVNPDKVGTYKVTYTVTDSAGQTTTVERTVNVVKPAGSILYDCSVANPVKLEFPMPVIVKGKAPASVQPGAPVTITDSQTVVKIPASTANVMRMLGTTAVTGSTDEFILKATNNDATIDVAKLQQDGVIHIPQTPMTQSGPLTLTVPEQGLEVSGLTAGHDGEMKIQAGEIKTTMKLVGAPEMLSITEAVCNPMDGQDTTTNTITIDGEKPELTLNGDNPMTVAYGSTFHDPGAKATDNVDGDLTNQIQVTGEVDTHKLGTYTLTYTVSDNAGNTATAERTVKVVDTEKPKITLNGDNPMTVELGSAFEDPGATATDNVDGDLTDKIQVTGEVNTDEYGTYTVTYSVTDSSGNTATATRTVHVVKSSGTVTPGDNEGTKVYPGEQVTIGDSGAVLTMPDDLPVGTTLKVTDVSNSDEVINAPDLILAGEVYHFDIQYPDGQAPKGKFTLTLTYDAAKYSPDQVDIYYYNEQTGKWEKLNGNVDPENGTITVEVTHFSTYGVFAKANNSGGDNGNNGGNNNGDNGDNNNGGSGNGNNGGNGTGGTDNGNSGNGGNNGDSGNNGTDNGGNNGGSGNGGTDNGGSAGGGNGQGGQLPVTATMNPIGIAFGSILAAIGAFILARKKKLAR